MKKIKLFTDTNNVLAYELGAPVHAWEVERFENEHEFVIASQDCELMNHEGIFLIRDTSKIQWEISRKAEK